MDYLSEIIQRENWTLRYLRKDTKKTSKIIRTLTATYNNNIIFYELISLKRSSNNSS